MTEFSCLSKMSIWNVFHTKKKRLFIALGTKNGYSMALLRKPPFRAFIFKSAGEVTQEPNPKGPPLFYCKRDLWGQTFRGLKPARQTETIISFPYHKTLQFNYIHWGPLAVEKLHLQRLKDIFYTPHLKGKRAGCFTPASFFSESLLCSSIIQTPSCVRS